MGAETRTIRVLEGPLPALTPVDLMAYVAAVSLLFSSVKAAHGGRSAAALDDITVVFAIAVIPVGMHLVVLWWLGVPRQVRLRAACYASIAWMAVLAAADSIAPQAKPDVWTFLAMIVAGAAAMRWSCRLETELSLRAGFMATVICPLVALLIVIVCAALFTLSR